MQKKNKVIKIHNTQRDVFYGSLFLSFLWGKKSISHNYKIQVNFLSQVEISRYLFLLVLLLWRKYQIQLLRQFKYYRIPIKKLFLSWDLGSENVCPCTVQYIHSYLDILSCVLLLRKPRLLWLAAFVCIVGPGVSQLYDSVRVRSGQFSDNTNRYCYFLLLLLLLAVPSPAKKWNQCLELQEHPGTKPCSQVQAVAPDIRFV